MSLSASPERARRAALLCVTLLLAACSPVEDRVPPLVIDAVGDGTADLLVADSLGAGLTARDSAGRIVPGLAQSWRVSDDGLSIVFRLREAQFADERPVTAADVVAAIDQRRGRRSPTAPLLAGVAAVSAPLPTVVEIRLSTPQPELLDLLATPELAIHRLGVQAGPFRRDSGAGKDDAPVPGEVWLVRNPNYFAAEAVELERVTIRAREADAAIRNFVRGETELVTGGLLDGVGPARVAARRETLLLESPPAVLQLLVNHGEDRGGLSDPRVRRAITLAIDRAALGRALFGSEAAVPVHGLVPANLPGFAGPVAEWAGRPLVQRQEEARRLLVEAGFDASGNRLRLPVAVTRAVADERLVAALANDLAQVGIDLSLERRSSREHDKAVADGNYALALVARRSGFASSLPFLLPFTCERNRVGSCLPEADRLLADSWKAPTLAERLAMLAAAERLWAEDGAAIGLIQPLAWSLVSPRVSGFSGNSLALHELRLLRFQPDRKALP